MTLTWREAGTRGILLALPLEGVAKPDEQPTAEPNGEGRFNFRLAACCLLG